MKLRTTLVLLVTVLIATWVACSVGSPIVRGPGESMPEPAMSADAVAGDYEEGLLDLSAFGAAPPSLPTDAERAAGLAALREGLALAERGDAAGAAREYDRAASILPGFADWAGVLAARAFAGAGEIGEVERRVAEIGAAGAGEWAWRTYHDALLAAGDTARSLAVAGRAATAASTASERAFAWSRAGELHAARRDGGRALEAFRAAMRESPSTPGGLAAARGAHDLPGLTADDRLLVGRTLLAHGGIDRGIPMLEAYAASPGVAAAERNAVLVETGRTLFNARRYEHAERHLRAADALPEAGFLLARAQYRQGRQEQGVRSFQAVVRTHPTSTAAADALFLLGDLDHDAGRVFSAAEFYRQAVATGVHNVATADAAVRLAGIALMAGDVRTAQRDLNLYMAQRPRDRVSAPAVYWLGRTLLALGDPDEARARFREVLELDPFSYYGMLAARRLGTSLAAVQLADPPVVEGPTAFAIETAFFRMELLRDLGLADESDLELARLQATLESDHAALYYVAEALARHGQPVAGALLGRRIQIARGVWDDRLLRIVHQFPYRDEVVRESTRNGLDPYAVAGLIRQESLFNPIAVSPAGAVGLMQVMPQTAAGLARRAGIASFQPSMLRDPDINLRLGTLYLADQVGRWGGRLSDVYGAYNAGPNRVVRWRQFPEHRDDEIYVERIPIAETRDYIKRVSLNGEIYRRLYSGD
jgi:soluble lytic murein transglycosylase